MDTPTAAPAPAAATAATDLYVNALDAASDALGIAIRTCLEGGGTWRFAEVQRLCKIGQAIMRVRARTKPAVGAYVDPNLPPPPGGCVVNRNVGGVDQYGAHDDLGLDDPEHFDGLQPFLQRPMMNAAGPLGVGGPLVNPIPPRAAMGGYDGIMEMLRETLSTIEGNSNKISRLDLLRELGSIGDLLTTELSAEERDVLQTRRAEIIAAIAVQADTDRPRAPTEPPATPQQVRHARCDTCGTAHDADWVTTDGRLRTCDICGSPMRWSDEAPAPKALPPTLDSETTSSPPEPEENELPCPPSSRPRPTSGTSRRHTVTSASKRSVRGKRS